MSFASTLFSSSIVKETRYDRFLNQMNEIIPRNELIKVIESNYIKSNNNSWRPRIDTMILLKMTMLQTWYNLSDPAVEELCYDRISFQKFLDIDLNTTTVPDETTIVNFRKFMNENNIQKQIFDKINQIISSKKITIKEWTIVDATILPASWSTKNKEKQRDPEMWYTYKGKKPYFWAKAHIWVDDKTWLVHTIVMTPANESDISQFENCMHWWEKRKLWDRWYRSKKNKKENEDKWIIYSVTKRWNLWYKDIFMNIFITGIRKKVEHVFGIIKNLRWHRTIKYKWISKNENHRTFMCWLANIYKLKNEQFWFLNI